MRRPTNLSAKSSLSSAQNERGKYEGGPTTASPQSTIDHQDVPDAERRRKNLRWHELENYAAAIRLNRSYLLGETRSTIYSRGPINAETLPLVEGLLRLHDFGILTFSGQPQLRETPELIMVCG